MAIANYFYNSLTRKYVALFGTYFNQIKIQRDDNTQIIVPISYAPYQKILAKLNQDPDLNQPSAITLPRMSFELNGMNYDGERKISPTIKIRKKTANPDTGGRGYVWAGAPYNLDFNLYIMAKYNEDAVKILEQILPFFNPEFTSTVKLMDDIEAIDVPLILTGVTSEEVYEGSFEERRSVLYTLSFNMKGWFFGPNREKPVIKFVEINLAANTDPTASIDDIVEETFTTQPGLTANGEPTTDFDETVDYTTILINDDWDIIRRIVVNV